MTATYGNGAAVSTAGWTFTILAPKASRRRPRASSINAAAGTIAVSSYAGSTWPDSIVVITPNTPVSSLTVTANTIPYDFWALTLPHMPSRRCCSSPSIPAPSTAGAVRDLADQRRDRSPAAATIANPGPGLDL